MISFTELNQRAPYFLPIVSALALVLTLPPFNLWPIVFVALIPLYIFIFTEERFSHVFFGGIFFGLIFSSYLSLTTLSGFTWIPEAHLFSTIVKFLSIPIALVMSVTTALIWIYALSLRKYTNNALERSILFGTFSLVEWVLSHILFGFNYGSLAYASGHFEVIRLVGGFGGVFLITFLTVFINATLAEVLLYTTTKKGRLIRSLVPLIIMCVVFGGLSFYKHISESRLVKDASSLSIAVIQNDAREESDTFGVVKDGHFTFPLLEEQLHQAVATQPDVIIYPFSPWVGVLSNTINNDRFNKEVIAIDFETFGTWLHEYMPEETVLVTWDTHLEDDQFWNTLDYWKNGALVDSYKKRRLFPFLDYTPLWSQNIGLYTTPYDAGVGGNQPPIHINEIAIGQLICSEVIGPQTAKENSDASDVIFSVGSEAMFESSVASEVNLLNAQLRAVETGRPVIRANKFGPSAIIDRYGNIVQKLEFNETGVLSGEVVIANKQTDTLYKQISEYPFMILLILYTLSLRLRKRSEVEFSRL
ncbi:apolipoprotein N-acyltransferase [candidate division KSB1 bacterium]